MVLEGKRIGFAMTGSFCTFNTALECLRDIVACGAVVTPIVSYAVDTLDTRFNKACELKETLTHITGNAVIRTIPDAEPLGPRGLFDVLVVLPATGNTLAKLAAGITDTPVTMAVKSHLRNSAPVVLAVSTNDALGNGAKNIGSLMNARNIFFVPFGQDDPKTKERSMVFKPGYVLETISLALNGRQLQPILAVN